MNRLADSLSPYLLQHKDNPVDWFPWGEEAFDLARQTDRPIFLSVGYAACHWCHVMEHESFENQQIAAFLNEHFVSIKVDREERPDIDQIYMNAVQVMTGRGGWPMSVFLDHDRKPFYAGTYWPPTQKFGMPGFAQVLDALAEAWRSRREEVQKHAIEITGALEQLAQGAQSQTAEVPADSLVTGATDKLLDVLDRHDGGFGGAPKFPHATDLQLLLQRGHTTKNESLIGATELTLDRMAAGGIRDHVGGGFARYSVDAKWLVPHFEKMLYDNALLAEAYVRAYQVTGNRRHADVAIETLDYLCRDMIDPAGGFHCSEDADSEGVEGKFYVWTPQQVAEVLEPGRAERFCEIYDITAAGNFEGHSIPHLPRSIEQWSEMLSVPEETLHRELAEDRQRLFEARERRVRPGRDDKVLSAWNALAINALAIAGGVLEQPRYIEAASRAAEFILNQMSRPDGRLLHAYRDGRAHLDGYVDDYAYTAAALLSLFEVCGDPRWVREATRLVDIMLARFQDEGSGGFFYTADDSESLITRNKDWHDGSLISGNAAAAGVLLRLSRLCDRPDDRVAAERVFRTGEEVMATQSAACGALLGVLDTYWHGNRQWVMAVTDQAQLATVRRGLLADYRPHTTLSWVVEGMTDSGGTISLNEGRGLIDGQCALYRCKDYVCDTPLVGDDVSRWLGESADTPH